MADQTNVPVRCEFKSDERPKSGLTSYCGSPLKGVIHLPGDKSVSHRAILLGAMAEGTTLIEGLLEGEDVLRSAACMRALGADIEREEQGGIVRWRVEGFAGQPRLVVKDDQRPAGLYFGNAGTGVRLALGLVAGLAETLDQNIGFDGDESLRGRPMGRIIEPLSCMGAKVACKAGRLPVVLASGQKLKAIDYTLPVASAQIKSAILLAGLCAEEKTTVEEPILTRDHTENMLRGFGVEVSIHPRKIKNKDGQENEAGQLISIIGGQRLQGTNITVPGDPSSAAFLIAAALIVPDSVLSLKGVMMNPLRTGFMKTVIEMGADISVGNERVTGGEKIADLVVRSSALHGVNVPATRASDMIDEYPILSVLAAFAQGETMMPGIGELRVKESDRIAACVAGLTDNGVEVTSGEDWMCVKGRGASGSYPKGGKCVATYHDHRIAMAFLILGLGTKDPVTVDSGEMIATSFPNFLDLMATIGARIE